MSLFTGLEQHDCKQRPRRTPSLSAGGGARWEGHPAPTVPPFTKPGDNQHTQQGWGQGQNSIREAKGFINTVSSQSQ